jgi:hypothetical protein
MPIKSISRLSDPDHLIQVCAGCGAEHRISLNRGAQKAKTGPVALQVGDTLVVRIDARPPETVTFAEGDFPDFSRITAAELAAKLHGALVGVIASDDAGGLLIESATTGPDSRLQIVGGSARAALGFATDGNADPCPGRPVLGISFGPGQMHDPSVLALRRCNDCGANECLVRTFDAAPPGLEGTHFHEHRKVVNALAEHCKSRGWSHPDVAAHHAAETVRPVDIHSAFPDQPLELSQLVRSSAPADALRGTGGPQ